MFWFTLAGHLKSGTADELKRRMTSVEYSHWKAIHKYIAPIGELRDDYRAAKICSVVAAGTLGKVRPSEDYLLRFEHGITKAQHVQSADEAEVAIDAFLARA